MTSSSAWVAEAQVRSLTSTLSATFTAHHVGVQSHGSARVGVNDSWVC